MKTSVAVTMAQKARHTGYRCCKCKRWKSPEEITVSQEGAVCRNGCDEGEKQAAEQPLLSTSSPSR